MYSGLVQRNGKIILDSADSVEHGIAVGEQGIAGLFQRAAAGQIVIQRFAVLRVLFLVVGSQSPNLFGNQVVAPFQIF